MKIRNLIVLLSALLLLVTLCACGDTNTNTDTSTNTDTTINKNPTYTVKVVDYKGNPISSGLFVEIFKGEESVGFKKANQNGEAAFELKEEEGYTFELTFASLAQSYNKEDCTFEKGVYSKEIMLYNELSTEKTFEMSPYDPESGERYEYTAYYVNEGATLVPIDGKTYYVFEPTRGGIYKFSYIADRAINIGYYGGSEHFVFEESTIEIKDRAFEIEVKNEGVSSGQTGTTRVIIGISSMTVDSCYLTVERIGEPKKEIQRNDYVATQVPSEVQKSNYLNAKLTNIDITNKDLKIVYNPNDNRYHIGNENGTVVLVRITSASPYIAPFMEMCETSALYGANKDDEGNVASYDVYNLMFEAYAAKCDDSGVVPLTKELYEAIKKIGEHSGWFEGATTIFKQGGSIDEETGDITEGTPIDVPSENAPFFACCYLEKTDTGTGESVITITDTAEAKELLVMLSSQGSLNFKSSRTVASTLTIENAQGIKIVVGETEYTADENGKIEIAFDGGLIEFSMVSLGDSDINASFTFVTKI